MRKGWLIFSILVLILFIVGAFVYLSLATPRGISESYKSLKNPSENLSDNESKLEFDNSFVYFLLASIKAYELHNPPLSSNNPKISIYVGDKIFSAVIDKGQILVDSRDISNPDIIITTSLDEAVKMVRDPSYVKTSFSDGKSSIDLKASKAELFSKGYLNLYTELTGKSITGNIVRIYTE